MEWIKPKPPEYGDEVSWKPMEPSEIVGKIISKKTVNTKYGPSVILGLETSEGPVNVWCNRGGLKQIIEEHDDELTLGRHVGFRMTGKTQTDGGNTFFPYEFGFADGIAAGPARSSVAADDEPF